MSAPGRYLGNSYGAGRVSTPSAGSAPAGSRSIWRVLVKLHDRRGDYLVAAHVRVVALDQEHAGELGLEAASRAFEAIYGVSARPAWIQGRTRRGSSRQPFDAILGLELSGLAVHSWSIPFPPGPGPTQP